MGIVPRFPGQRPSPEMGPPPYSLKDSYRKASELLRNSAINMDSFADLYAQETIDKDKRYVEEKKGVFARDDRPEDRESIELATVLEAVILDQVNRNGWFGPAAKAIRTTEFDDYRHGVDSIIEFKEPARPLSLLALGIDVTYKHNLHRKFERIKSEIDLGELATIKYFRSSDGTERGERKQIPHLIIGVDRESCQSLARAWYQDAQGLRTNPTRFQIVKELKIQLEAFERYARKTGKLDIAERYAESKYIINKLMSDVESLVAKNRKYEIGDTSLKEMENELYMFS